jgi:hypothetical protein
MLDISLSCGLLRFAGGFRGLCFGSSGTISYKELSTGLKRSKATGELRRNRSLKYIGLILNTLGEAPFETLSAWPWRNGFLSLAGLHAQLQELLAAYDEEVLEETMVRLFSTSPLTSPHSLPFRCRLPGVTLCLPPR